MKKTVIGLACTAVLAISVYQMFAENNNHAAAKEKQVIEMDESPSTTSSEILAVTAVHEEIAVPALIEPAAVELPLSELERLLSTAVDPEALSDKELTAEYDALTDFIEQSGLIERLNDEAVGEAEMEQVNALFQLHDRLGMAQMKRQMSELTLEYNPEELDGIQHDLDQLNLQVEEAEALIAEIKREREEQEGIVQ